MPIFITVESNGPVDNSLGTVLYSGLSNNDAQAAAHRRRDLYRDPALAAETIKVYCLEEVA